VFFSAGAQFDADIITRHLNVELEIGALQRLDYFFFGVFVENFDHQVVSSLDCG